MWDSGPIYDNIRNKDSFKTIQYGLELTEMFIPLLLFLVTWVYLFKYPEWQDISFCTNVHFEFYWYVFLIRYFEIDFFAVTSVQLSVVFTV